MDEEEDHKPSLYCYRHKKCRRPECRALNTEHLKKWRSKASAMDFRMIPHGLNGYENYCCRCPVCRQAKSDYYQSYKEKKWEGGCPPETPAEKRAV